MSIFSSKERAGGFMDEIRCDEQEYLIWKWHPFGSQKGNNLRENAIRWGSSLRVRDGSVAAFVYNQKNGVYQDFVEGPYDGILKTVNLPVIANVIGLAYEGGTPFQAEVYFINLAQIVQIKFAVPYFDVYDSRFLDFGVPTAVRGTLTFHIKDYRQFIKLHRLDEFNLETFRSQVQDATSRYVKAAVTNAPVEYAIPLVQIERHIKEINQSVQKEIEKRFSVDFGVEVTGVDIAAIELDKTSSGYAQLKAVTQDISTQTVQVQADVNIKNLRDQQRINSDNLEEILRVQREEMQYAQHKQTQTANFAAYQLGQQAAIGIAGAEALGQMGSNGATSMDSGSGNGGMDPAAMMAGMAIGGALGQNMAGMMNGMMGNLNQPVKQGVQVPPPVPELGYYVAVDGTATGPFDKQSLTSMAASGRLFDSSLLWKPGMSDWKKAGEIQELSSLFSSSQNGLTPPPIPNDD